VQRVGSGRRSRGILAPSGQALSPPDDFLHSIRQIVQYGFKSLERSIELTCGADDALQGFWIGGQVIRRACLRDLGPDSRGSGPDSLGPTPVVVMAASCGFDRSVQGNCRGLGRVHGAGRGKRLGQLIDELTALSGELKSALCGRELETELFAIGGENIELAFASRPSRPRAQVLTLRLGPCSSERPERPPPVCGDPRQLALVSETDCGENRRDSGRAHRRVTRDRGHEKLP
jgi:hypothetical protein